MTKTKKTSHRGKSPRPQTVSNTIVFLSRAIARAPKNHINHIRLGDVYLETGETDKALVCYDQALKIVPRNSQLHNKMAFLYGKRRPEQAILHLKQAIAVDPGFILAYNNLSSILNDMGLPHEAIPYCQRAIEIQADNPQGYYNLAIAFFLLGNLEEAFTHFKRVIELRADYANAYYNLAFIGLELARPAEALAYARAACRLSPDNLIFWQTCANSLAQAADVLSIEALAADLEKCLAISGIDRQQLANIAIGFVKRRPDFSRLLTISQQGRLDILSEEIQNGRIFAALSDSLLFRVMEIGPITDSDMEELLTQMRRIILLSMQGHSLSASVREQCFEFLCSLANQCFLNEYIFYQTSEELELREDLRQQCSLHADRNDPDGRFLLVILASYEALHELPWSQSLAAASSDSMPFRMLLTRHLTEVEEEKKLREGIKKITAVSDTVSSKVQAQYEQNPYPRWLDVQQQSPSPLPMRLCQLFPQLRESLAGANPSPDILIAGCGTGKHAIQCARIIASARILALDLSRSSLAYAFRKSRELGIDNIEFAQADILHLETMKQRFDVIESVGVLHHLQNPEEGWRILAGLLRPEGFMRIGLYSASGRQQISAARAIIAERGYTPSLHGIREFRHTQARLPEDNPLSQIKKFTDYYSTSGCRDLLFHVQEHCFTLPEIAKILEELGLEFLGFEMEDSVIFNRFKKRFPDPAALRSLVLWHQFELDEPETFRNMYQFWVRKKRNHIETRPVVFNPDQEVEKALRFHNSGQLNEAQQIYEKILRVYPGHADTLDLSGFLAYQRQDIQTAITRLSAAIASNPNIASFHGHLAQARQANGQLDLALKSLQTAIRLDPQDANFWSNIGDILRQMNRVTDSLPYYKKAISLDPRHLAACNNMGNTLSALGRLEEAIASYHKALEIQPNLPEAYNNCGTAYMRLGNADAAMGCYQKAVELRADYADAHNNIGFLLQRTGILSGAITAYQKALAFTPGNAGIYHNLGNTYMDQGKFEEARKAFVQALALRPDFAAAHSNVLFSMNYDPTATPEQMCQEARRWWQQQGARYAEEASCTNPPDPDRRLRIGYVSPDFCVHSVNFFFLSLLGSHASHEVETFCYSDVVTPDRMTERVMALADHYSSVVGMNDEALAALIKHDQIDILVDLAGHTAHNRLLTFARQPAPVQVTWLGYPNTTGLPVMDYRFSDQVADPENIGDRFYTEQLYRLPHGFLCYTPPAESPEILGPPMLQGKGIGVTFGSFNNLTKINPDVVAVWSEILRRTPGSRLLLKSLFLADNPTRHHYLALFSLHGIPAERLQMLPKTSSLHEHLDLYNAVDISLDTFPYNGTTTTCEALWMGVPVVAMRGEVHASRVSASLLFQVGLDELIAETKESYITLAVDLAHAPDRLASLRQTMRPRLLASPLCDAKGFARDVETAFRQMWQTWCRKAK